jgi:hypothetical protein
MAFPEYQLRQYLSIGWIREKEDQAKWVFGKRKRTSSTLSLEDDIYNLRLEMERLVKEGYSLTSHKVVEISMILDQKINEYMNANKKNR